MRAIANTAAMTAPTQPIGDPIICMHGQLMLPMLPHAAALALPHASTAFADGLHQ